MTAAEYPKRETFFAVSFVRLMGKTCIGATISPDACWLLSFIAATEDAKRYSGPVTFYNANLADQLGLKLSSLIRARKKAVDAGWLHYEQGAKGIAGKYWVTIPPKELGKPDGPSCVNDDGFPCHIDNESERENTIPCHIDNESETKAKQKQLPFLPIPNPNPKDSVDPSSTKTRKPKPKPAEPEPALPFSSSAFREAWEAWKRHRKRKRKALTPEAIEMQFADFLEMGEARAIAGIRHSIKNDYQGFYEPKPQASIPSQGSAPKYRQAGQRPKDDE